MKKPLILVTGCTRMAIGGTIIGNDTTDFANADFVSLAAQIESL